MIVVWVVLFFLAAGSLASSLYFYRVGIARTRKEFLAENPDLAENFNRDNTDLPKAWMESQPFEEHSLVSDDGLTLRGYYLAAPSPTDRTAILVHGYTARAADMGNFARLFVEELGFNVLAVDCRGHGKSQGNYIGFGWHDRKDLSLWIGETLRRNPQAQIVLMGVSMGAGTVLMTAGEDLPGAVKAVVADCGYTSARDILTYQLGRMYHLPAFPIIPLTSLTTRLKAGYFLGEASALRQVSKAKVPILFIHGEADLFVPLEMAYRLAAACRSPHEVWTVPGAGHGLAYQTDPAGYRACVEQWAGRYLPPQKPDPGGAEVQPSTPTQADNL